MPRAPPALLRSFGRGLKPAVGPIAVGGAVAGGSLALGYTAKVAIDAYGRARNPPFQIKEIDTDGDGKADGAWIGDPRTGSQNLLGDVPHKQLNDNERSEERTLQWLIIGGAAVAIALVVMR